MTGQATAHRRLDVVLRRQLLPQLFSFVLQCWAQRVHLLGLVVEADDRDAVLRDLGAAGEELEVVR